MINFARLAFLYSCSRYKIQRCCSWLFWTFGYFSEHLNFKVRRLPWPTMCPSLQQKNNKRKKPHGLANPATFSEHVLSSASWESTFPHTRCYLKFRKLFFFWRGGYLLLSASVTSLPQLPFLSYHILRFPSKRPQAPPVLMSWRETILFPESISNSLTCLVSL